MCLYDCIYTRAYTHYRGWVYRFYQLSIASRENGTWIWGNLEELFLTEDDYIYFCDPARRWGFSVFCVVSGDHVGKWTKQKRRDVAALETAAASVTAWESGANTLLPIGNPELLHKDTENILWGLCRLWSHFATPELFCHKNRAAYSLWNWISRGGESRMMGASGLLGYMSNCAAPPECSCLRVLSFATQGWGPSTRGAAEPRAVSVPLVLARCRGAHGCARRASATQMLNLAPDESSCSSSTALAPVSCTFNGTALRNDEMYGWAIKEKLERKIYNFPLKPVIHVINIDVI